MDNIRGVNCRESGRIIIEKVVQKALELDDIEKKNDFRANSNERA